jgi:hypothetical protein
MANQKAKCVRLVRTLAGKDGKTSQLYAIEFNGVEVEVFRNDKNLFEVGKSYSPVVEVKPQGYTSKNGGVYARNAFVVNWEEAK